MCGIFAVFNLQKTEHSNDDLVKATSVVSHRGPDNMGRFSDEICFLGHTRLSIIDLHKEADQPFFYEDLVMIYNGEVFNFIELREELRQLNYIFETTSDTEVVLKAFHAWGEDCFAKFNGMWALVIYNRKTKSIIVSRDRFAQKPLYAMKRDGAFYFASEVQQLTSICALEPDYGLIQMFMKEGGYEGGGRTFFKSVELFPKSSYCVVESSGQIRLRRYWDYYSGKIRNVDDGCMNEFDRLLEDAVKIRLRSDVPYGIMLSGGVDSTIIASYARQFDKKDKVIPAFTYSSANTKSELPFAQSVADELNLPLTAKEQDQNPEDYIKRLKKLVKHLGRGHSSPATVSIDHLYESVRNEDIKVALDGQGADELLAGYKHYFPVAIYAFFMRGNFKQVTALFTDYFRSGFVSMTVAYFRVILPEFAKKIGRYLYGYERLFKSYKSSNKKTLFNSKVKRLKNRNLLNRYLIRQHDAGLENLLFYGDIVAMNNSVENRSPFMDYRLVDFVFSCSEKLKIWGGQDKYVLRKSPVYERFRHILDRKKVGFASSIRPETIDKMNKDLMGSPVLDWPIFESGRLLRALKAGDFKTPKYERLLFRLYQVHLWHDIFGNKFE